MCDCYPGSLLASFHKDDPAADAVLHAFREAEFKVTSMTEYLQRFDASGGRQLLESLPHRFFQITVPPGSERAIASKYLRSHARKIVDQGANALPFLDDSELAPLIETEGVLQTSQLASQGGAGQNFGFTCDHNDYLQLIGSGQPPVVHTSISVGIIDSGYTDTQQGLNIVNELDFTTASINFQAADTYGHGSVVASIVHSVSPTTKFRIYKVARSADVREWGFLAALVQSGSECCIINASIGFGLHDKNCGHCGRDYHSSRSLVFERVLHGLLDAKPNLVFVAAAGNQGRDRVTYPARYPEAVCVGSTDGGGHRSTFSNYGAVDHEGKDHPSVVFAPGGDQQKPDGGRDVYVASFLGKSWRGTSFATAYVTGIIADYLNRNPRSNRHATIAELKRATVTATIDGYDRSHHGEGMIQHIP